MDTKKNNKKKNQNQGIFSFLFRDNDQRQQRTDEPYALCAPTQGLNGVDLNCVLATQGRLLNHSVRG